MSPRASTGAAWDCVVVGGGPAGLSAAVYMGRFLRRTLVVDDEQGRWTYGQTNDNYLGFPNGVSARRLQSLGSAQARRFGVSFRKATVTQVNAEDGRFRLDTTRGVLVARTVIWAAGVQDIWPECDSARTLVGKRMYWCIVCDGWRTLDRSVLLLGDTEAAARTALQFLTYTSRLTFLVDARSSRLTGRARARLASEGIAVRTGCLRKARERDGAVEVTFDDGSRERIDYIFSLLGSRPRTAGLEALKLRRSQKGNVATDDKGRTNVPGFLAAGDVTDRHAHQVASAVHEGAEAAQAANSLLYPPRQRMK